MVSFCTVYLSSIIVSFWYPWFHFVICIVYVRIHAFVLYCVFVFVLSCLCSCLCLCSVFSVIVIKNC